MARKISNFLIYCTILTLPLYLVRFSIFTVPTNLIELSIGLAFALWVIGFQHKSKRLNLPKKYWLAFVLIFLGITLSASLNPNWATEAGIIKSWFVIPFLFFILLVDLIDSPEKREKIMKLLFVSSASVGFVSLIYLLAGKVTFDGRLEAFYLSPNYLAMFLVPGIIFGLFSLAEIILKLKRYTLSFYFIATGLSIMLIALYFTFSYGAWVSLILGMLLAIILTDLVSRSRKIKVCFLGVLIFGLLFSFQLPRQKMNDLLQLNPRSSSSSRMMIWVSAWKIGQDNFFWGIGPGNFQNKYLEYQKYFPLYLEWAVPQPHNLYLAFWLQGGILGLFGFLLLVSVWIKQVVQTLKNKKSSFLEAALLAIMLSVLIHGMVDTPYWKNDLSIIFWTILALGLGFILAESDNHSDRQKTYPSIR